jgi:putative lipase involved disintegration of autophagic bodies
VLNVSIPRDTAEARQAAYYGIRSDSASLIVVGARGSTTGRDWLEDFNLYSESTLLQFFSLVVPMTYVWPYEATASMVKAFSFTQRLVYASQRKYVESSNYYKPVQDYAEELQRAYPNHDLLLLGHSLGGATAQIAAARMRVRGFGFEPPGTVFSQQKFGIPGGMRTLDNSLVTVMRQNDPIVYVDAHAGEIQQLVCPNTFLTAYCHYMHPITCHLMANCNAISRVTFDHWGGGNAYCGVPP